MGIVLKFKQRVTGAAGAPTSLKSGEPAINNVTKCVYVGFGDDGNGNATEIVKIYDPASIPENMATTSDVSTAVAAITFLALAGFDVSKVVRTDQASAFAVSPTVPTPAQGDNSTKAASTAYVDQVKSDIMGGLAPEQLNSFLEVATQIQANADAVTAITATAATKTAKAANLSDLADLAAAWANLGGGSLGKQAADAVAITGGTINNVTFGNDVVLDGGVF